MKEAVDEGDDGACALVDEAEVASPEMALQSQAVRAGQMQKIYLVVRKERYPFPSRSKPTTLPKFNSRSQ